jgi:hypothetical protein
MVVNDHKVFCIVLILTVIADDVVLRSLAPKRTFELKAKII